MNIYNITHSSDIDGLASAALLVHYYSIPTRNVFFAQPGGKPLEEMIKLIRGLKGSGNLLVISDLAVNPKNDRRIAGALSISGRGETGLSGSTTTDGSSPASMQSQNTATW